MKQFHKHTLEPVFGEWVRGGRYNIIDTINIPLYNKKDSYVLAIVNVSNNNNEFV